MTHIKLLSFFVGLLFLLCFPGVSRADEDDPPETRPIKPVMPTTKQVAGLDHDTRRQLFRWLRMLRDGDVAQRKAAVLGLMRLHRVHRLVLVALVRALHDTNQDVRFLAAYAVATWGPDVVPLMRPALGSHRALVRWAAAFALSEIKNPDALVRSSQFMLLRDSHFRVRGEAIRGLSLQKVFSGRIWRAFVYMLLRDPHFLVRILACRALRRAPKRSVPVWLQAMERDTHPVVRRIAAELAARFGGHDPNVRKRLLEALVKEQDPHVSVVIFRAWRKFWKQQQVGAAEIDLLLKAGMRSQQWELRWEAIRMIAWLGLRKDTWKQYVQQALQDPAPQVQKLAQRTWKKLQTAPTTRRIPLPIAPVTRRATPPIAPTTRLVKPPTAPATRRVKPSSVPTTRRIRP